MTAVPALAKRHSLIDELRLIQLVTLADGVMAQGIPGDVVECGVADGGSAVALAATIAPSFRHCWLYDSFGARPLPLTLRDGPDAERFADAEHGTVEGVRRLMEQIEFPPERLHLVPGLFADTLERPPAPTEIALLHVDADWYESVWQVLDAFYDRVSEGGAIVLDDFGYWEGCRLAFYDFCRERHIAPLLERVGIDQAWWIKGRTHNRPGGGWRA